MSVDQRQALSAIKRFDQLIAYLRDELGWPISKDSFDDVDDLFYDFSAEELGIDPKTAAKIQEIKRLRPLSAKQPWGIFFVKFEPKKLPIVALRRILGQVARKKRASSNSSERTAWSADDLLFISNYGEGDERQISFAHFSQPTLSADLPTLRVLGWNNLDTPLHLDAVATELTNNLRWPEDDNDLELWRKSWSSAFKLGHNEVINTAKDLSIRLAELASNIRGRIKATLSIESESGPLTKLMKVFQSALVHDLNIDSFADMYAQTIAYGLLSARISDPAKKTVDDFTAQMRTSPFLKELLQTFLHAGGRKNVAGSPGIDFDELGVGDVVTLLNNANIEAVVRDFGDRNQQEDPVMHFFEGFLHAYDSKIRKDRGVFYTPQPVVSYIVRSIHEVLQSEFGLKDGLADTSTWGDMLKKFPESISLLMQGQDTEKNKIDLSSYFVQILDPATGTGTFIVEVIDLIHSTLMSNWQKEGLTPNQKNKAWNDYVPAHLLPRLHAFELMMAPYAIAHMKVGLKLAETGYKFKDNERLKIYLTNALEPWLNQMPLINFHALSEEAKSVNEIKQHTLFTVIVGNPPYSGHSSNNDVKEIVDKVHDYKKDYPELQKAGQGKWLQNDYVKFIRFSEILLTKSGVGILGFITDHSYLDNPTFKGMRRHLLDSFNSISITDIHGNSKKGEKTPSGATDENVFDITQGVAVSIFRKNFLKTLSRRHIDIWGSRKEKYSQLLFTAKSDQVDFSALPPFNLFRPQDITLDSEYQAGWALSDIFNKLGDPAPGIVTTHDEFAISWSKDDAIRKIRQFIATKSEKDAREIWKLCSQSQWNYALAKKELENSNFAEEIVPINYRPFDTRYTLFNSSVAVHRRDRLMRHILNKNNLVLITTRQQSEHSETWGRAFVSNLIFESSFISNKTKEINYGFPLWCDQSDGKNDLLSFDSGPSLNINENFISQLNVALNYSLYKKDSILDPAMGKKIFMYIYAILNSTVFRKKYANFLRLDFPRIPIIKNIDLFNQLSSMGEELVNISISQGELDMSAGTTFTGQQPVKIEKVSWSKNTIWLDKELTIGFKEIPEIVWKFEVGCYQVCEKWLKDRKGKTLTASELEAYQSILRKVAALIKLTKNIDNAIEDKGVWSQLFLCAPLKTGS